MVAPTSHPRLQLGLDHPCPRPPNGIEQRNGASAPAAFPYKGNPGPAPNGRHLTLSKDVVPNEGSPVKPGTRQGGNVTREPSPSCFMLHCQGSAPKLLRTHSNGTSGGRAHGRPELDQEAHQQSRPASTVLPAHARQQLGASHR